jgi:hypothetical protein
MAVLVRFEVCAQQRVYMPQCYWNDPIKTYAMGLARRMYLREEKCIHIFVGNSERDLGISWRITFIFKMKQD